MFSLTEWIAIGTVLIGSMVCLVLVIRKSVHAICDAGWADERRTIADAERALEEYLRCSEMIPSETMDGVHRLKCMGEKK